MAYARASIQLEVAADAAFLEPKKNPPPIEIEQNAAIWQLDEIRLGAGSSRTILTAAQVDSDSDTEANVSADWMFLYVVSTAVSTVTVTWTDGYIGAKTRSIKGGHFQIIPSFNSGADVVLTNDDNTDVAEIIAFYSGSQERDFS